MSEKLQKAIETAIAAGYQLNRDAFEFLSMITATDDPTEVVSKALQRIKELEEKPFFIDRTFLETLLKPSKPSEETQNKPLGELDETQPEKQITGTQSAFYPYAKDVKADINIVEDPTGKLNSNGSIEDYLQYFQDRFKRLERLLRQRIDVKAATPIAEAVKSPPKTKLKIIGIITEKREAKQQIMVTIEDLQTSATVLVSHNAPEELHKKARLLLPDQVVCIAVAKTRSRLFLAEDIIFPEVGQKPQHRATEPIYAVLTSDMHVGSNKFQKEAFKRFILWLNGKYGNDEMKEIAGHVKYVLIAGDIVDGVGIYPNQAKELVVKDIHKQYRFASRLIEQIPDYVEVIVAPGNHDAPRQSLPQPAIANDYLKTLQETRKVYSVGNPCLLSLHKVEVLMYHGRSLDDIIATVPGMDHEHPEKSMKLLLQSRHLAPVYGGKTMLSPENRDYLVIERVPDVFHAGHTHVLGYCNYRGVLIVNSGGWQEQTEYMQKLGLVPTPGKVPVVDLQTLETTVLSFV
ncbi:MAG: DNA-directed DNA polymerase II small subunit [Candidatus Bathyarchaeota archaeon]|nr:DNA-directed DNA polymerase II small subunit [Candidatus Bathyarchaeota archaeon]